MSLEKRNGTRAGTVIGVHVELDFRTDYLPPRQILTGFLMLAEQSAIDLDLRCRKTLSDSHPERALVRATVDGHEIAYDVADDYYFDQEKTEELLSSLDAYFKRSYDPLTHDGWEGAERIHRLGFNYHVELRHKAFHTLDWAEPKRYARVVARRLLGHEVRPLVDTYEVTPHFVAEPTAIFYARVWNPAGETLGESVSADVSEHRSMLNEMRAECVRQLNAEFGPRFSGGLEPTAYALAHPDYSSLVKDRTKTSKKAYLEQMHRTDVCVGSLGLGDANGWKMGEYVAASRAIVNERMRYLVPGDFAPGRNYQEFTTADECVEQVGRLLNNPEAVHQMKCENQHYYREYLRPDKLVLRSLQTLQNVVQRRNDP